jgi:Endonuclease NucS
LKLNEHEALTEERRKIWAKVSDLIGQYTQAKSHCTDGGNPAAKQRMRDLACQMRQSARPTEELSSVARWCILLRNDPSFPDSWVNFRQTECSQCQSSDAADSYRTSAARSEKAELTMAIYEITKESLLALPTTTFSAQDIRERYDLQRLLRTHINAIDPEIYVLAEEYGEWEDAKRRIDLLCVDKEANLVVVELKRSEDGGHMDLQAIRYAAMISTGSHKLSWKAWEG